MVAGAGKGMIAVQHASAFPVFIGVMRDAGKQVMANANRAGEGRDGQPCGAFPLASPCRESVLPVGRYELPQKG